jgi:hypothetical protein
LFRCERARPGALIESVREAVLAHEHGQPAADDQTLVAVEVIKK